MPLAQYKMPLSDTMKRNIDSILNTDYDEGEVFRESGIKIVDRPATTILSIECVFHGKDIVTGEDYDFEPYNINKLVIEQKFSQSYSDYISIVLTLTPLQLLNILDNYRDLKCTLIMKPMYPKLEYVDHTDIVYEETFNVFMKDKELRKRVSKEALIPSSQLDQNYEHSAQMFDNVEFQLIKPTEYLLRKKKFNFMLRDATMKDVILYLAKCCDINKVCITEPDNTRTYTNLIIPPQKTFASCMEFLQDYYGIYNKGLSYYYTRDVLYVYPTYETSPNSKDSAHFYYAGPDACSGVELYHAYSEDNMLHVVISSMPVLKDLVDGGIENFGNATLFQFSDRIMDIYSSIGEGQGSAKARMGMGKLDIKEPNTSIFALNDDDYGVSKDAYNVVFKHTSNLCKEKSETYSYLRSLVGFQWQNAWPDSFKPGYLIHYHYDGEDISRRVKSVDDDENEDELNYADSYEYMTRDGIVEEVTYTFKAVQGGKQSRIQSYSCVANVVLSVEYEPAMKDQTPSINTSVVTKGTSAFKESANVQTSFTGIPTVENTPITNAVVGLFDL